MAENQTQQTYEKITAGVEKIVAEQGARYEAAIGEISKLQAKSVEQAQAWVTTATRAAQEQIAFAEQLGGEWRKTALALAKTVTESFAPKA
jgi:hypothetical protein